MFRRRIVVVRRPRLLGAALLGGAGFLIGRRRGSHAASPSAGTSIPPLPPGAPAAPAAPAPPVAPAAPVARVAPAPSFAPAPGAADPTGRLGELARLHDDGSLTDEEFSQAKREVLGT